MAKRFSFKSLFGGKKKPDGPENSNLRPRAIFDIPFVIILLTMVAFGLIMMFSAGYAYAYHKYGDGFLFIKKQGLFAAVGIVLMFIISMIDYKKLVKLLLPLMVVTLVLMVVVLFMAELSGAKRWILIGDSFQFQPSELAKFVMILFLAQYISVNYKKMNTIRVGLIPPAIFLGILCLLMVLQPHLSGTILILMIAFVMLFVGGIKLKWFAIAGIAGVAVLLFVVFFTDLISYATSRLSYWIDPFSDPQGKGFQTIQSLFAIASGGVTGLGLGNSHQKYLYLPEPQNDFIFSIICEELGFVGAVLVIVLFIVLVIRGFYIAYHAENRFGFLLTVGLISQVGIQAALNIAVVTNTIPNTGISLPFFSYGGTSLIMLLMQMGVVLSVSRYSTFKKT